MARATTRNRTDKDEISDMTYAEKKPTTDQQVQQTSGEEQVVCSGVNNVYTDRA
jgi:hypothetical protein